MDRKKIKSLLGLAILRVNEVVPDFEDLDKVLPLLEQAYDEADKSDWISVKERLPEFEEEVLVTNEENKEIWFCHRSNKYGHVTLDELQAVKEQYPWFAPVVDNWKELSLLFEEELDKRLYMRIRQLCKESDAIRYEVRGGLYYERFFWYNV